MRKVEVSRNTNETKIALKLNLDGEGIFSGTSGVGFMDHMLDQIAKHGLLDLDVNMQGDLHIDAHHSLEDLGITLGMAFNQALGDKRGIYRYGHSYVPLDESLSRVVIDFSGRGGLFFSCDFTRDMIGQMDTQLVSEFFQGFVNHAQATLHIDNIKPGNAHHQSETIFKAFGQAVRMAVTIDSRRKDAIPSTKGVL